MADYDNMEPSLHLVGGRLADQFAAALRHASELVADLLARASSLLAR